MERRIVTVLFADLVGFTTLSEALDAEDVAAVQDAYFAGVRQAVARHGGRLEKFIGDAAVAAFGADRTREDDAERAVRAGLAIVALIDALGARLGLDEDTPLSVRVGVQTGEVAVATDGPDAGRLTGDTMNTAARLQAAADPGSVLCGRPAVLAAGHAIDFAALTPCTLKGKAVPVLAAAALGERPAASRAAAMGGLQADLVGREDELTRLAGAIARVIGGCTERWTVIADPGVGKSRLMAEVRDRAASLGTTTWAVRLRAGEIAPFAAVGGLLRAALGSDADPGPRLRDAGIDPDRAAVLARAAAGLLAPDPATVGPADDLAAERSARFRAWLDTLDGLAGGRAQLWLVEDVHWAGGDLLAFLALAGSSPAPAGRLVIATARPALLDLAPGWPEQDGAHRLDLAPLPTGDAIGLVHALVGDALPDDLASVIAARADGNPLFIEELLRSWVSLGILVRTAAGTAAPWALTASPADVPMPETVQALYAAQLDDLPPAARDVARRASVAGRRFPDGLLGRLGMPESPVRDGLAVLIRGTLIDGPRDDAVTGPGYGYRHALLRDAGYASLAKADRARLHLAVARWLASLLGAGDVLAEAIGRQLAWAAASMTTVAAAAVAAGEDRDAIRDEAATWLARAADRAIGLAAHAAAATLLRESIALTDPGRTLAIAERTARLGEVLAWAKNLDEAAAVLADARDRLAALLDGPDATAARTAYAAATMTAIRLELERLRFRDGIAMADAALDRLGDPPPDADAAAARVHLARGSAVVYETNRGDEALGVARRVGALARATGDRGLELDALRLEIVAIGESGGAIADLLDHQAELIRELGRTQLLPTTLFNRAMERVGPRTAEALSMLDEADREARAQGQPSVQAWVRMGHADIGLLTGDWDGAMRWGREALDVALANAFHRVAVRTWFVLAPIATYRGDSHLLQELGDWLRERTDLPDSPYGRLMHAALDQLVAAGTGADPVMPDPHRLAETWGLPYSDAAYVAARDAILRAWWDDGRFDDLTAALAAMPDDPDEGPLAAAARRLWLARMGGDEPAIVGLAREALELARRWGAAWWIEQAIAILDDVGDATRDEREERRIIRLRLLGEL